MSLHYWKYNPRFRQKICLEGTWRKRHTWCPLTVNEVDYWLCKSHTGAIQHDKDWKNWLMCDLAALDFSHPPLSSESWRGWGLQCMCKNGLNSDYSANSSMYNNKKGTELFCFDCWMNSWMNSSRTLKNWAALVSSSSASTSNLTMLTPLIKKKPKHAYAVVSCNFRTFTL